MVGNAVNLTNLDGLDFEKAGGMLPAVVQHFDSGSVLMLGYMTREALEASLTRGRVVFFSRRTGQLWEKGEASGNTLALKQILTDCDRDSLLVLALPQGPTCHLGSRSCFGDEPLHERQDLGVLSDLERVIGERMRKLPKGSYTTSLFEGGVRRIAQKVGEEGLEVALAAVGGSDREVLGEFADLLYHLLVLLRSRGLGLEQVAAELRARRSQDPKPYSRPEIREEKDARECT